MYIVKEILEMDRNGNNKECKKQFNSHNDSISYIKNRMMEVIKADTIKFLRKYNQSFCTLSHRCENELQEWLEESDGEQFPYVASYLGWSCFWILEVE